MTLAVTLVLSRPTPLPTVCFFLDIRRQRGRRRRGKRGSRKEIISNATCFGCGKKGHITNTSRSEMRGPSLGRNRRRAKRAPGRCLRQNIFIHQCRVMHYSQMEGSSILDKGEKGADSTLWELEKRPEQVALPATAKEATEWRRL